MTEVDIDHLKSWIGRQQRMEESISLFPARAMAAILDHQAEPALGDLLPCPWHWLYFLETPSSDGTGVDGHPKKGGFLPPVPLPRRMWAAGSLTVESPLRIGDRAEKVSTIRSVESKAGKTGEMVFVEIEHAISQAGRMCIREKQTLVYRPMPTGPAPLADGEPAPEAAQWSRVFNAEPVQLFRFSALTYNAHRIHYDRDYAINTEFYPGLVVHAPLLVTLLLNLVTHHEPEPPLAEVSFRAIRPTFDLGTITLSGKREGRQLSLWSTDHHRFVGLRATAVMGGRNLR